MDVKVVNAQALRFGKKPPIKDYRTFQFANYTTADIPAPPKEFNSLQRVYTNLKTTNTSELFPMDANDKLGDCTIAGMAHGDTVWSALVGNKSIYPEDLVVRIYFHLTNGEDSGLAMLDVLKYFQTNIVAGEKIIAYVSINPYNHTHVKQAMNLFGGLFLGFQVQENCLIDFKNNIPWTPGKLINAGHAVFATGYTQFQVNVLTWGDTHWGSWDWWDSCVDEVYAILPPESLTPGFAPGFNFDALQKDLKHISSWY